MGCLPTNSEEEEEELEPLRFSYEVMGRSKSANYTVVINYRKYDFLSEEYSSGSTTVNRGPSDRWGGCCNYPQRLFFNEYNVIELDNPGLIVKFLVIVFVTCFEFFGLKTIL